MAEPKSFQEHWIPLSLMGCTLATGSDKDEVQEIRQVAIDFDTEDMLEAPAMWIGLASEPMTIPPNTDVGGPFGWIDGCTQYTKNVFFDLTANAGDQSTLDSVFPDFVTDANESSNVEHDGVGFWGYSI